jgi:hypothetical protein
MMMAMTTRNLRRLMDVTLPGICLENVLSAKTRLRKIKSLHTR